MTQKTLIVIIEDDEEIRQTVVNYLRRLGEYQILFAGSSVEAYLYHTNHLGAPDIILLDIGLPGISGCEGVKLLKSRFPETQIIMYTVHDENNEVFQSICNGASGYLLKSTPLQEVHKALRDVFKGGSVMSPIIARKVIENMQPGRKNTSRAESDLTPKEEEIVHSLVEGFSYKKIADNMNISVDTVRSHIKNIYKKLHVHSRGEVVKKSLKGEI
ncbi:MAG: response regulator transcription factor [Calditrichia bacterium]